MKGNTEVTSRLLMPVLIDAKSGDVTDSRVMPVCEYIISFSAITFW